MSEDRESYGGQILSEQDQSLSDKERNQWGRCVTHHICDCQAEKMQRLEADNATLCGQVAELEGTVAGLTETVRIDREQRDDYLRGLRAIHELFSEPYYSWQRAVNLVKNCQADNAALRGQVEELQRERKELIKYFRDRCERVIEVRAERDSLRAELDNAQEESKQHYEMYQESQEAVKAEIAEGMELRQLLWLHHGHDGLYGDDGKMQCSRCGLDFKRHPIHLIGKVLDRIKRERKGASDE